MRINRLALTAAAGSLLWAAGARAGEPAQPAPPPASQLAPASGGPAPTPAPAPLAELPPPEPVTLPPIADVPPAYPNGYGSALGFAVVLGGGYEDFTSQSLRNTVHAGESWNARFIGGTHSIVGFEAAYVGSTRDVVPLGASTNAKLLGVGLEGVLRLNAPIVRGPWLVEPYGFAGLGWTHYWVMNASTATSDLAPTDNVMTVPLGGGLSFAYKALLVDLRGSYTPAYFGNFGPNNGTPYTHWGAGGNLGVAF
jgi:hypothetical protein